MLGLDSRELAMLATERILPFITHVCVLELCLHIITAGLWLTLCFVPLPRLMPSWTYGELGWQRKTRPSQEVQHNCNTIADGNVGYGHGIQLQNIALDVLKSQSGSHSGFAAFRSSKDCT